MIPVSDRAGRLLVTVESPSGRHALRLPLEARVQDLLPRIVEVCEGASGEGWRIRPRGEGILAGGRRLGEIGLFPGALLELIAPEPAPVAPPASPAPSRPWGRQDYRTFLERAITSRELTRSMVVAVMSAHPGAGTSTVAALLATRLGWLRQDPVVVVDANAESGALSHWLAPDAPRPNMGPGLDPHRVISSMVGIGDRTSVLPAPSEAAGWDGLIEHLRRLQKVVVLDCPAGFTKPACRAALAAAEVVVLVSRSPLRQAGAPPAKTVVIVENQAPRRARSRRLPGGAQVITLVDDPAAADRLKTRGFSWSSAPASWRDSISELAALLVGSEPG